MLPRISHQSSCANSKEFLTTIFNHDFLITQFSPFRFYFIPLRFIYFFREPVAKYTQSVFFSGWKKSSFTSVKHRTGQKLKNYTIQNKFHVGYVNSVSIHSPIDIFRNSGRVDESCQLNRHPLWSCVLKNLSVFDSILRLPVARSLRMLFFYSHRLD
jgi:hypothetical protein